MNTPIPHPSLTIETTYGVLAVGYAHPRFLVGAWVHVIGFASPTSTGIVEEIEAGNTLLGEAPFYYTVDFRDGECTAFAEDEIELATTKHKAARAAYDANPPAFYNEERT